MIVSINSLYILYFVKMTSDTLVKTETVYGASKWVLSTDVSLTKIKFWMKKNHIKLQIQFSKLHSVGVNQKCRNCKNPNCLGNAKTKIHFQRENIVSADPLKSNNMLAYLSACHSFDHSKSNTSTLVADHLAWHTTLNCQLKMFFVRLLDNARRTDNQTLLQNKTFIVRTQDISS